MVFLECGSFSRGVAGARWGAPGGSWGVLVSEILMLAVFFFGLEGLAGYVFGDLAGGGLFLARVVFRCAIVLSFF